MADAYRAMARMALEAAAAHLMAAALALADQWQEDFPYKASQLRDAIGDAQVIPDEAVEAEPMDASEEVRRAFANREANIRTLVARAAGVSPDVARELGY